jgi:beta-glucosidase
LALNAGIEMDMVGEGFLTTLKKSLNENKVSIEQIDNAVRLILNAKYDLGLFQDPYKYCDVKEKMKFYNRKQIRSKKNCITIFSIT